VVISQTELAEVDCGDDQAWAYRDPCPEEGRRAMVSVPEKPATIEVNDLHEAGVDGDEVLDSNGIDGWNPFNHRYLCRSHHAASNA
jgi:hypothetical protein